jgi:hypothetical protein
MSAQTIVVAGDVTVGWMVALSGAVTILGRS